MRQARGLLPYAAAATLIVGVTVVALVVATLAPTGGGSAAASASPAATTTTRPATDLSPQGRLAYWRSEANCDYVLWLANADNSRRRSIAKSDPSAVSRTKWSADGGAVAYVDGGVRLVIVGVDGVSSAHTLSRELRLDGYRIVDHRFSPSGTRIAATVQRATGSQSDVYLASAGGAWTRLTTTEDVLAADWISDEELLVQTTGGIVGRLRASGRDQLRPLTGLPSATPIIGEDGRVYFLSGRVSGFAGPQETLVFAASASVWSMTIAGEDLRREPTALEADSFRLDGQWPGGFLVHRGTNPGQIAVAKTAVELPTNAGLIERLAVSPDRKYAIGFAGTNLVRIDIAPSGTTGPAVVLLGSVTQGDAWFPRKGDLAQVTSATVDVPSARFVFALGGHLWTMGSDGLPTLLRGGNTNSQTLRRFTIMAPRWSPSGDRVLTVESLGPGASAFQLIAATVDRNGVVRRYTTPSSIGALPTWSPDGRQLAVVALPAASQDPVVLSSDLSVLAIDANSGATVRTIGGREAFWTTAGLMVLSNGTWRTGDRARHDQAIELWTLDQKRQVTTVPKLIADSRMQAPAQTRGLTQTSLLTAAPDGQHAAVHITFLGQGATPAFAVLRTRDGAATAVVAGDGVGDEAWSSTGRLIGYTLSVRELDGSTRQRAVVRDAETGDVLLEQEGRFAGWSPDGSWIYIAKADGLYARRLAGGDAVRFAPYGVVVSATRP